MKLWVWVALALLGGCQQGDEAAAGLPGSGEEAAPYAGIAEDALLRFTGTEPFWGGSVSGTSLTWSTPENPEGTVITVSRFAGNGGLAFSGTLDTATFDLMVTPGQCSDGMSDRTYPFTATVQLGSQQLNGCAWREGDDLGEAP